MLFIITLIVNSLSRLLIWSMARSARSAARRRRRRRAGGGGGMSRDHRWRKLAVVAVRRLLRAVGAARARAARVHPVLRRQRRASQSLNLDFFTQMPKPVGETGGGMANAIVGTLIVTGLGSLFAIPIGILSGVYMSEYAGTRLASLVRFAADTLNGVPSIVIGVFVYGIAVLPFKQFSALAGGLALGIMMIPIIARTTEELLLLVPGTMREGALALGATRGARGLHASCCRRRCRASSPASCWRWRASPARRRRCSSRRSTTASSRRSLTQPISSLTVQVYTYAISPYEDWHRQAWAGALVLVTIVFICSLLARFATRRLERIQSM